MIITIAALEVNLDLVTLGELPKAAGFPAIGFGQFDELEQMCGRGRPSFPRNMATLAFN